MYHTNDRKKNEITFTIIAQRSKGVVMNTYVLEAIIAIPIFLLEILFLYCWFKMFYLPQKGLTVQRLKKRVREFRQYQKKLRTKEKNANEAMEKFLKKNRNVYEYFVPQILCGCVVLYVFGIVCAMLFVVVTEVMWGNYPIQMIMIAWMGIIMLEIFVFVSFWMQERRQLKDELDQYIDFLLDFIKLPRG